MMKELKEMGIEAKNFKVWQKGVSLGEKRERKSNRRQNSEEAMIETFHKVRKKSLNLTKWYLGVPVTISKFQNFQRAKTTQRKKIWLLISFWCWWKEIREEYRYKSLQYSCLENPMDGEAWRATVHGVAKSQTWLRDFTFTFHLFALEKEMATHSRVLAWRIPGMGSHRVRHDWTNLAVA